MEEERIQSDGEKTRLRIIQSNLVLEEIRDFAYVTMLFVSGGIVHYFYNDWITTTTIVVVVMYLVWLNQHYRKSRFDALSDRLDEHF